jgi:carbamoyltransferase
MNNQKHIILGIHDAHDASAALMVNGEVVAAAQEERFTRLKGDYGYPQHAIDTCLKTSSVNTSDITEVVLATHSWNPVLNKIKRNSNFSVSDWVDEQETYWKPTLLEGKKICYYDLYRDRDDFSYDESYPMDHLLRGYMDDEEMVEMKQIRLKAVAEKLNISEKKVRTITHEECHSHYAYWGSSHRDEVLCLTAEGMGDYSNGSVSRMSTKGRKELAYHKENHIGHIYQYITLLLGMKPNQHEYKVMGLAPYASEHEIDKAHEVLGKVLRVDGLNVVFDQKPSDLYFHFRDKLNGCRFDGIAGAVQKMAEELLKNLVRNCVKETGLSSVIFSGGVAQNIKAMKTLSELNEVSSLKVLPAAGDTSLSIGACYYAMWQQMLKGEFKGEEIKPLEHVYLGNDIEQMEIEGVLENAKGKGLTVCEKIEPEKIAELLAQGLVLGRCVGRMEFGLRALGNRSIIADPRRWDIVAKINEAIKFRDFWMPFTPSMLEHRANDYLVNPKEIESPFMTHAFDSTSAAREELPAAMHPADKTVRPQIVSKQINKEYFNIISAFEKKTGVGAILNTSFNLHGEPIVANALDAYSTFERSGLDGLIIGDAAILK